MTRDRDNKAHIHTIHTYLFFTRKSKKEKSKDLKIILKDVKIVAAEISLINSVPVRIKCLLNVDIVEDASIAGCVKMLKLKFKFMFG